MALKVGDKAPILTLKQKTPDGLVDVSLGTNIGVRKTILLFYPLSFTSVCTSELCSVSSSLDEYANLGADVYAISVDSPFAQEAFAKASRIEVPILSDFNREASTAYDVLFPELIGLKGVSKRAAFVISKDGTIIYAESSDNPAKLPDFERIRDILSSQG